MLLKILFTALMVLCTASGVVLVHFLPVESKSLKWNLNARTNCYYIPLAIDCVVFGLSCYFFGQDVETADGHFALELSVYIGMVLAVFFSDRYAVRKRIKPYISEHPEEYEKYEEKNVGYGSFSVSVWDSFWTALFLSAALWIYYMLFWLTEPI